jgi:hypothetical protein
MTRFLLRSGKFVDVDNHPNHLDVVSLGIEEGNL